MLLTTVFCVRKGWVLSSRGMGGWVGEGWARGGLINIKDMYSNNVGEGGGTGL